MGRNLEEIKIKLTTNFLKRNLQLILTIKSIIYFLNNNNNNKKKSLDYIVFPWLVSHHFFFLHVLTAVVC